MPNVLHLPARGRLLVATDLQGNVRDFRRMRHHFEAAGPDATLLFVGDLVHGPSDELLGEWPDFLGTPYPDDSPLLLEEFEALQRKHPGRVHSLLGNHEHAHVGGPTVSKFHADEAAALEARLGPERTGQVRALFRSFPLIAVAPNGVVVTHAAPSAEVASLDEFERVARDGYSQLSLETFARVPVIGPTLWSRMAKAERSRPFLKAVGGTISLYGHDVVREGFAREETDQLCFSTSFALYDEHKVYVELDLASRYPDNRSLREGVEIRKLY